MSNIGAILESQKILQPPLHLQGQRAPAQSVPRRRSAGGRGALCGRAADLAVTAGPLFDPCGTPVGPPQGTPRTWAMSDFWGKTTRFWTANSDNKHPKQRVFFGTDGWCKKRLKKPRCFTKKPGQRMAKAGAQHIFVQPAGSVWRSDSPTPRYPDGSSTEPRSSLWNEDGLHFSKLGAEPRTIGAGDPKWGETPRWRPWETLTFRRHTNFEWYTEIYLYLYLYIYAYLTMRKPFQNGLRVGNYGSNDLTWFFFLMAVRTIVNGFYFWSCLKCNWRGV